MIKNKIADLALSRRIKIVKGHINKVLTMWENQEDCINIVHQSQAVQKALREIDTLILENHLNVCLNEQLKKGKTKKPIDEIMKVIKRRP